MNFTNQKPFVVGEGELKARWGGAAPGVRFRCGLCGHRFQLGDTARWICTRLGNPFLCVSCDGPDVLKRWEALHAEFHSDKFWFLRS